MSKRDKRKNKKTTLAKKADKYVCYQKSVQSPDHEIEFFEQAFRDAFRRKPLSLREDFCGTFAVCCSWVASHRQRTAVGVDLDPEPLTWGKTHNLSQLSAGQSNRVRLLQQDVRKANRPQVDILTAQNFSFWVFKTRQELIDYFCAARSNLKKEGLMIMDMMGGGECLNEDHTDKRTIKKGKNGFKYYWKQARYNPINHDATYFISFKFADGSSLKHAFEYNWRFWSIPEVREMLAEAGFRESHVYWEETDENGDESGNWCRQEEAPSDPSWISYIVAIK